MRLKLTFFLILLNLGVFHIIYQLERTDFDNLATTNKKIFGTSIADIGYIEIGGHQYSHPFTLKKQNKNWHIAQPINWPANLFAVQRIITQLQFIEPEISLSVDELKISGQSLADFGLDNPAVSIKFYSDNRSYTLDLGKPTSLGNRIYVLSPDRRHILVVKQSLLDSIIGMSLEDLRRQQIFNIPIFELNSLNVHVLSPHNIKIKLSRLYNQWQFEAPIQVSANSTLVNSAISQLPAINVKRFVLEGPDTYQKHGLQNPSMRITLKSNHQHQTLLIGDQDKSDTAGQFHFARLEDNDTVFTLSAQPFLALRDAQEALREKRFIHFNKSDLRDITISNQKHATNLQQLENEAWQILQNSNNGELKTMAADTQVIEELLTSLKNLEAIEFVSDAPSSTDLKEFGFETPQLTIRLHGNNNPTLVIGNFNEESGYLYAKLSNAPHVYHISPAFLQFTSANPLYYKNRILEILPNNSVIQKIKLTKVATRDIVFEYALPPEEKSWENALSNHPKDTQQLLVDLVDEMKQVSVKNYLAPEFNENPITNGEGSSPWTYKLEASVLLPGQDNAKSITREYFLSERLSGQKQIAGSPEHDLTFSLTQNWIDIIAHFTQTEKPAKLPDDI